MALPTQDPMPDTPDETDLFASLAVYDPDLVERCAAHVRSGAEPDLPETLAQLAAQALPAEAGFDLATVGELFAILMPEPRMVPSCTTTARQAVWQAMQGRGVDRWSVCPTHLKYHVLAAPTAQQVVRLARVLAALSTPDRLVDGVPVWCTALVNIRDTIAPLREDLAPRLRQQWDCDWLSTVLAASGTPHDQIPAQVLLVTFQTPEYFQPGSVPVDLPGLDEYLVGHAAQIPPGTTAALDPRARVILVSRTSLADGLPAVVGELTCDPAKTVRVAAVTALQRLPAAIQAEVLRAPLAQVPA
ncbi:MAG: hypothetical protein FWE61_06055, partial [Micrococcales bacterium]|nr:hypothetical protein [Micrococcales bacterium]